MSVRDRTRSIHLSIVIPVYNGEELLERAVKKSISYLTRQPYTWELIIVNDGSTDDTHRIISRLKKKHRLIRGIGYRENRGKGHAVKTGALSAKGSNIIFYDVDLAVSVSSIGVALRKLAVHPVVIGVRRGNGSVIVVHQPLVREWLGRIFTWYANALLHLNVRDVTCGFKGFQKQEARELFNDQWLDGWAFDAEILYLARKKGYSVYQLPVKWSHRTGSKVSMVRDSIASFVGVLRIRFRDGSI
jgi:dolichyl-phosphate beta-glucosyltransferase